MVEGVWTLAIVALACAYASLVSLARRGPPDPAGVAALAGAAARRRHDRRGLDGGLERRPYWRLFGALGLLLAAVTVVVVVLGRVPHQDTLEMAQQHEGLAARLHTDFTAPEYNSAVIRVAVAVVSLVMLAAGCGGDGGRRVVDRPQKPFSADGTVSVEDFNAYAGEVDEP